MSKEEIRNGPVTPNGLLTTQFNRKGATDLQWYWASSTSLTPYTSAQRFSEGETRLPNYVDLSPPFRPAPNSPLNPDYGPDKMRPAGLNEILARILRGGR
jgi:hypothetical protein